MLAFVRPSASPRVSARSLTCGLLTLLAGSAAQAQLVVGGQFDAATPATGVAHDPVRGSIWVTGDGEASIRQFSITGQPRPSITLAAPLGVHTDIDVAPEPLTLNGVDLPAGTVLLIDSNDGNTVIRAFDPETGTLLATLQTTFGAGHAVGGAYHPERDSFFLCQDREPGNPGNMLAEIDPATGSLLAIFVITNVRPGFTVERGDLDIAPSGNLLVASSDESAIGEFSPLGDFIAEYPLPAGVGSLSGIASDPAREEIWGVSTGGQVWKLRPGVACAADFNADDALNSQDFFDFLNAFFATAPSADFNADLSVNSQDFFDFLNAFFAGC